MSEYYFDIETSDLDPWKDQVIAAAYQPIKWNRPSGDLVILNTWTGYGEKEVLSRVVKLGLFDVRGKRSFDFIPVGTNLLFDLTFLIVRMHALDVKRWTAKEILQFLYEKPMKDIKTSLVAMNDGSFTGSGLERFTAFKRVTGAEVPKRWRKGNFKWIERYIRDDAKGFFEVYSRIAKSLLDLGEEMRVKG